MKKNIVNIMLILLAAGFLYKVIWYNRTMPSEPKLESGWTDIEFSNNYGSAVMHEFLTLNLTKEGKLNVTRHQGFMLFPRKIDRKIVALFNMKDRDIDKIALRIINGREKKYMRKDSGEKHIYFFEPTKCLLVTIDRDSDGSTCVIEPITREEWEKL